MFSEPLERRRATLLRAAGQAAARFQKGHPVTDSAALPSSPDLGRLRGERARIHRSELPSSPRPGAVHAHCQPCRSTRAHACPTPALPEKSILPEKSEVWTKVGRSSLRGVAKRFDSERPPLRVAGRGEGRPPRDDKELILSRMQRNFSRERLVSSTRADGMELGEDGLDTAGDLNLRDCQTAT